MNRLFWTTGPELEVTALTPALRDLTGIGLVYRRLHVSDLWPHDAPYGMSVMAHRRALEGEAASFEAAVHGGLYRIDLQPLHSPDGRVVGVAGQAMQVATVLFGAEESFGPPAESLACTKASSKEPTHFATLRSA